MALAITKSHARVSRDIDPTPILDSDLATPVHVSNHGLYVQWIKCPVDLLAATLLLVLLSPLFVVIAVLVRIDSRGPVIFRQVRVGKDMRLFKCYKFRTMVADAECILAENHDLRATLAAHWKVRCDPRATPVGRFLRKTSLDELPQLINVLKGEMSLVGPRPYMPQELAEDFSFHAAHITCVRPGMTGLWQVSGRALLTPYQRIALDKEYACVVSLGGDVRIVLKTVKVVFHGLGAF